MCRVIAGIPSKTQVNERNHLLSKQQEHEQHVEEANERRQPLSPKSMHKLMRVAFDMVRVLG